MSERERLEERASALFTAARSFQPVDRRMLERVAERLEARPRRHGLLLPLAAVVAAAALLLGHLAGEPRPEPASRSAPVAEAPALRATEMVRLPELRLPERPAIPPPMLRPRPDPVEPAPLAVERPSPPVDVVPQLEVAPLAPPSGYTPRAIAEFQQVDWRRLEESDELPAYVQSIVSKRDRRALLAALDRLDLDRELRLIRGELRAGEDRCSDAVADFDAVLGDGSLRALHPRASRGRQRCSAN